MNAALSNRDSVVVMPTGGGKSLCYQAPALLKNGVTVVVSPLISLMKDQVDGLVACGVAAAQMNSSLSPLELRAIEREVELRNIKLLFVSPERLAMPSFRSLLQRANVEAFAIDEAHCISHWGHDFRPEYRQLRTLHQQFPDASLHAYTATATQQVRRDIAEQLALRDALTLVGDFDRPNLTYRILPRRDEVKQVLEVVDRHRDEAGIVYCMRRRDVDGLTADLKKRGLNVVAYHAGLSQEERRAAQDAFAKEKCDLVVATVAFGMGIDRSNVRFVIHLAMPKSIEHYQQETGRAGRDGLEAECVLLYSGSDVAVWRSMMEREEEQRHLNDMDRYCSGTLCRHRALVEYFGQRYLAPNCNACDICLGDTEDVPDGLVVAQKILSCVYRVGQAFGVSHVISVLRGEDTEKVRDRNHERLTTYGLMRGHPRNEVRDWIYQLIAQGYLEQSDAQYPVLRLTAASRSVMRGEAELRLRQPVVTKKRDGERQRRMPRPSSGEGQPYDRTLFEALRQWRRAEADQRGVPPYVVFSDRTLREVARVRPGSLVELREVYGIGDAKIETFGSAVLAVVAESAP